MRDVHHRFVLRAATATRMTAIVVGSAVVLALLADVLLDEPIRRRIEAAMNAKLRGYGATIGHVDFHVLGGAVDVEQLVIRQDAQPEPPVAAFDRIAASVEWRALLHGAVVADFELDRPRIHVTRSQAREENRDETPVTERRWQEALQAIYPLEINHLRIRAGTITYVDAPDQVVRIDRIDGVAEDIRNVASREREYPSPVRLEGVVFGRGRLRATGEADFLAVPHPGLRVAVTLEEAPLRELAPIVRHFNLDLSAGVLDARGSLEYAPSRKEMTLEEVAVAGAAVDWVHERATAEVEERRVEAAADAIASVEEAPELAVHVERLRVTDGRVGFVNHATDPPYRIYVTGAELEVDGFSNVQAKRQGSVRLRGRPMGMGTARVDATFSGRRAESDLALALRIVGVDLPALNDMLRAHANLDVERGELALFSELRVNDGRVDGYVKPILEHVDVYGGRTDSDDPLLQRGWEAVVGGVGELLENQPKDQIATQTEISGRIDSSRVSAWQAFVGILRNAFVEAMRPRLSRDRN